MSPADATGLVGSRDVDALPPPLLPLLSLVRLPVPALPRAAEFRAPDPVQLPLPFSKPLAAAEDEADEELLDCRRPAELPPLLPLTVPAPLITLALPQVRSDSRSHFSTLLAAEDEADEELLDCSGPPELPLLLPLTVPAPLITLALPAAALGAPCPIRLPLPISTLPGAEVEADEELLGCSGPPELPLLLPLTPGSPSASAGLSHALDLCGGGEPLHGSLQFDAPVRESAWMARPPLPPFPHHPLGGGYRRHGWLRVGARAAARSSARCLRRNPQTSENRSAFLSRLDTARGREIQSVTVL